MRKYKCKICGKIVERDSNKKYLMSYCEESGIDAKLIRLKELNKNNDE